MRGAGSGAQKIGSGQFSPGHDTIPLAGLALVTRVHDPGLPCAAPRDLEPRFQSGRIVPAHGLPRLDLDRDQPVPLLDHDIDLVSGPIPPEVQVRCQSTVVPRLEQFTHYPGLEEGTALRVDHELLRVLDAQQPGGQARIAKVQLRRPDQAITEILWCGGIRCTM